jgi:hypothetical protein
MKMKQAKPRFFTANDIRAEIDRYQQKSNGLLEHAASLDRKADELNKAGPRFDEDAAFAREEAKKNRRSAARIQEKKLPHLKDKLSEWMTPLLKEIIPDGDRSIQK